MFQTFFYQPVLNLLVYIYNIVPGNDLGIAIIILTIVIKLILYPLSKKAIESQKGLQEIQPELEEIKKKHKDDREALGKATLELYKEKKINPFSSCLPLLIQIPFLIAVFQVFRNGFANGSLDLVYSFISRPENIDTVTLGFFDLSTPNNIPLALIAGGALYLQTKMMIDRKPKPTKAPKPGTQEDFATIMNKQMLFMMPLLTAFFSYTFPAGLALYWSASTILTIFQQWFMFKKSDEEKTEAKKEEKINTDNKEKAEKEA